LITTITSFIPKTEAIKVKTFVFDLDDTIWDSLFHSEAGSYEIRGYYINMMTAINNLYAQGNIIIFQTARHWDKFEQTKKQLEGFKYHTLVMGNIPADYYVNDKSLTPEGFIELYEAKNL
jgi:hypothetical protein